MVKMKKIKSFLACILVFAFMLGIVPAAYASPCCEVYITGITQANGEVTVSYNVYNDLDNRALNFKVTPNGAWRAAHTDTLYASADQNNYTYTFSAAELVEDCVYTVSITFAELCEWENCYDGGSMNFTADGNIPKFKMADLTNGKLELVGQNKAALEVTASVAGFYSLSVGFPDGWTYTTVKEYPNNMYVNDYEYFETGESKTYILTSENEESLSVVLDFGEAEITKSDALTAAPKDNDKVFSLVGNTGLTSIEIPQTGAYRFESEGEQAEYFKVMDSMGATAVYSSSGSVEEILEAGTYYIDTGSFDENCSLSVTYFVPKALEFGKAYTMESLATQYYTLTAEQPIKVTLDTGDAYVGIIDRNGNTEDVRNLGIYQSQPSEVIAAGEYYIYINNNNNIEQEVSVSAETLDSMELDTNYTPQITIKNARYFAFCAPEDGTYELNMCGCNGSYYYFNNASVGNYTEYYTAKLEKDEWLLIRMYSTDATISVSEYTAPAAIPLTYEVAANYEYYSGKTYLYSFTPDADGEYQVYSKMCCNNVKIYTDTKTLYESSSTNSGLTVNLEMEKDIPVYIELRGTSKWSNRTGDIMVKSPYMDIESSGSVTLSQTSQTIARYIAPASGYYTVKMTKSGGTYYISAIANIGNTSYYLSTYSTQTAIVYLAEGEPLQIEFAAYSNGSCNVGIEIAAVETTELELDQEYTLESGKYYTFAPKTDAIYEVISSGNVDIISAEGNEQGTESDSGIYFAGNAGNEYIVYAQYGATVTISAVESMEMVCDTQYQSGAESQVYSLKIEKDGYYRFDNEICNTIMFLFGDDLFAELNSESVGMFQLCAGTYGLLIKPETEYEGIDTPYAKFKIAETENSKELGVSMKPGYFLPTWGGTVMIPFCVTAPYDVDEAIVGLEYVDEDGVTQQEDVWYAGMRYTDISYFEAENYWMELGKTYTVKPYVYTEADEDNKVFGEEMTFTVNMAPNVIPVKYNTIKGKFKSYNQYGDNTIIYSFTQPEGAESTTDIECSEFLYLGSIFDEDYNYVDYSGNSTKKSCTLEAGKTYYFCCEVLCDGEGEVTISSLPDAPEAVPYEITEATVSGNTVSFAVSGSGTEETVLYAAIYAGNKLLEVVPLENPEGTQSVTFDSTQNASVCKLILTEKDSVAPLCDNAEIALKNNQ